MGWYHLSNLNSYIHNQNFFIKILVYDAKETILEFFSKAIQKPFLSYYKINLFKNFSELLSHTKIKHEIIYRDNRHSSVCKVTVYAIMILKIPHRSKFKSLNTAESRAFCTTLHYHCKLLTAANLVTDQQIRFPISVEH